MPRPSSPARNHPRKTRGERASGRLYGRRHANHAGGVAPSHSAVVALWQVAQISGGGAL